MRTRHPLVGAGVSRRSPAPDPLSGGTTEAIPSPGVDCPGQPEVAVTLPTLARLVMEVLSGRRPLAQIEPMLSAAVRARLADRIRGQFLTGNAPSDRVTVRHAGTCWVNESVCEGVVMVGHEERTTALAIRIERHRGRWRVTEVAGPEFAWQPIGPVRRQTQDEPETDGRELEDRELEDQGLEARGSDGTAVRA